MPKTRDEIAQEFKWALEDLFLTDELWEESFISLKSQIPEINKYKNKISLSIENLFNALEQNSNLSMAFEKLFVYANMRKDQDNANSKYQAFADRASSLGVELDSASSFIVPEILEINQEVLEDWSKQEILEDYKFVLKEILRTREHTLSKELEELLSQSGEMASGAQTIYKMLDNADIKFGFIRVPENQDNIKNNKTIKVELTHGNFSLYLQSKIREVRQSAFLKLYKTYKSFENTYAATLAASNKRDIFYAKARKYNSALEEALSDENIPESVYSNLINSIHNNLPTLQKYLALRKKAMKLEELHLYDMYAPIASGDLKITYQEAQVILLEAFKPLGEEYCAKIKEAFDNNWIDVYENTNKSSGAYCWGAFGTHPFVLMSYKDDIDSLFTLAHELGHAMHSYYSDQTQKYPNAQYKIFVAEVASTFNEAILMDYMLKTQKDKKIKIRLLNYYLEQFRTTVFRQVMFAEFEKITHEVIQNQEALTAERLNSEYLNLNHKYFGKDVIIDPEIMTEWARISHFYNSFYVYKYATGFCSAVALSSAVLSGKQGAKEKYMNFLKTGGSDYPISILQNAGVDLTTPDAIDSALGVFDNAIKTLEETLG